MQVEEVLLVWNADAGLRGHLDYALQKLRGINECPLCDLTHRTVTEKPQWKNCKLDFGLQFEGVYRNRMSAEQATVAAGELPCVLARTTAGLLKLMGREAIDACGDLDTFVDQLRAAINRI